MFASGTLSAQGPAVFSDRGNGRISDRRFALSPFRFLEAPDLI